MPFPGEVVVTYALAPLSLAGLFNLVPEVSEVRRV